MNTKRADGAVTLIIPSDLVEARRIQGEIESRLKTTAFDPRELFGIKLAIEEALVNAIKHGNRLDPDKNVKIAYEITDTRFQIQIADEGPGYNPDAVPDCQAAENLTRPGGRGLYLIRYYMSEVVVHPPGNAVSMAKVHSNGKAK